ncbi:MAG: hypothetical protein ACYS1A_18360 [Planctomycetota bacterium]|jgi:hypothetical protein
MKHAPLLISGNTLYDRGFNGFDGDELNELDRSSLYYVTWPEHVHNAQFNHDCDYGKVSANEYRTLDDIEGIEIYADSDTWNMLPWFSSEILESHTDL